MGHLQETFFLDSYRRRHFPLFYWRYFLGQSPYIFYPVGNLKPLCTRQRHSLFPEPCPTMDHEPLRKLVRWALKGWRPVFLLLGTIGYYSYSPSSFLRSVST